MKDKSVYETYTKCEVVLPPVEGEEEQILGWGFHRFPRGTQFTKYLKSKGREWTMTKAFRKARLTKLQRTELWEAYRTSTKMPRWTKQRESRRVTR
jgi:hypothetical protein